jgi:hypothetical protein
MARFLIRAWNRSAMSWTSRCPISSMSSSACTLRSARNFCWRWGKHPADRCASRRGMTNWCWRWAINSRSSGKSKRTSARWPCASVGTRQRRSARSHPGGELITDLAGARKRFQFCPGPGFAKQGPRSLTRFSARAEWDGKPPAKIDPKQSHVELADGRSLVGEISRGSAGIHPGADAGTSRRSRFSNRRCRCAGVFLRPAASRRAMRRLSCMQRWNDSFGRIFPRLPTDAPPSRLPSRTNRCLSQLDFSGNSHPGAAPEAHRPRAAVGGSGQNPRR